MSERPPSRLLRVALLLALLVPALGGLREQERTTRSDSVPDLIAVRAPLARIRTELFDFDLPPIAAVPALDRVRPDDLVEIRAEDRGDPPAVPSTAEALRPRAPPPGPRT